MSSSVCSGSPIPTSTRAMSFSRSGRGRPANGEGEVCGAWGRWSVFSLSQPIAPSTGPEENAAVEVACDFVTNRGSWTSSSNTRLAGRSPTRSDSAVSAAALTFAGPRSEEHTSELQSRFDLVCRLLLEKKNRKGLHQRPPPTHPPPRRDSAYRRSRNPCRDLYAALHHATTRTRIPTHAQPTHSDLYRLA